MAKGTVTASIGIVERTERMVVIFIGLLLYKLFPHVRVEHQNIMTVTLLILAAFSAITVWQRLMFAYQKLR
jgi:hypothetical protein